MKNIPKVQFDLDPIENSLDMVHHFLNPSKKVFDWSHYIFGHYPELKKILKGVEDKNKRKRIELQFLKDFQKENESAIISELNKIRKEWAKINNRVMKTLSEIVEIDWPKEDKVIRAYISLCPINPRFIKTREFSVFYRSDEDEKKAIAIHEILHFIYFEKWKSVFPKTEEREFNTPHLVWQLSEMVTGIILNDKRAQDVFKHRYYSYDEYEKMKIGGKPLLSYLQKFYDERRDFEDFLRKSWDFVKNNEKEINKNL